MSYDLRHHQNSKFSKDTHHNISARFRIKKSSFPIAVDIKERKYILIILFIIFNYFLFIFICFMIGIVQFYLLLVYFIVFQLINMLN